MSFLFTHNVIVDQKTVMIYDYLGKYLSSYSIFISSKKHFNSSPNVIKNQIQIQIHIHAHAGSASLYDSKGALTVSENLNGVGEHNVNISDLANGVYILKFTCNDGSKLSMPVVITKQKKLYLILFIFHN